MYTKGILKIFAIPNSYMDLEEMSSVAEEAGYKMLVYYDVVYLKVDSGWFPTDLILEDFQV